MDNERIKYYFEKYRYVMCAYAINLIKAKDSIPWGAHHDLVSDAFVALMKYEGEKENGVSLFLKTTIKNSALNLIRHHKSKERHHEMIAYMSDEYCDSRSAKASVQASVIAELHAAIDKLPVVERMVFKMRYIEFMKPREICKALKMKPGTFDTNIMRVKHKLREQFKGRETY